MGRRIRQPVIHQTDIDWLMAVAKPVPDLGWRSRLLPLTTTPMSRVRTLALGELPEGQPLGGYLSIYCREGKAFAPGDWSTGLIYTDYDERSYPVLRCNGAHQTVHTNALEGDSFIGVRHIHFLTQRYQEAGILNSGYAEPTDAYTTLEGALDHLADLANLTPTQGTLWR